MTNVMHTCFILQYIYYIPLTSIHKYIIKIKQVCITFVIV